MLTHHVQCVGTTTTTTTTEERVHNIILKGTSHIWPDWIFKASEFREWCCCSQSLNIVNNHCCSPKQKHSQYDRKNIIFNLSSLGCHRILASGRNDLMISFYITDAWSTDNQLYPEWLRQYKKPWISWNSQPSLSEVMTAEWTHFYRKKTKKTFGRALKDCTPQGGSFKSALKLNNCVRAGDEERTIKSCPDIIEYYKTSCQTLYTPLERICTPPAHCAAALWR